MPAITAIVIRMKRYGQRCPAAIALDVIGERWTPLIVRELLLGPKRFTDLADGLPGIGTNILTNRLAGLQDHGVVEKRTLPRPTPVAVYELTDAGRALAPVLRELRTWGARFGPPPPRGDAVRPAWIVQSAAGRNPRVGPGRTCELRVGDDSFGLTGTDDAVDVRAGSVPTPEAVVTIEPRLFLRLASGKVDPADAAGQIEVEGDRRVADEVVTMLAGSAR
jgi:DNA-binding HxlR family transcriptional regulator